MKYIYLDWNVFQYIKHEAISEKKHINAVEFKKLIKKLSNKYIFPYSEAHLRDLAISNNEHYVNEDLKFIENISNNYVLGFIENEKIVIQKDYIDIKKFFDEIKLNIREELNRELVLDFKTNNSYSISIDEVSNDDLFKPFIEQNNGILDNEVFRDFIINMYQNIDNSDFYKKFRTQICQLKSKFENTTNTILDKNSNYYHELIPFLDFIIENDITKMKQNFHSAMISFLNIDKKRIFEDLTIGAKIELAYSLLDYNQHFRDKINNKNRPTNIMRDMKHLHYASDAKYYITEDIMTYKKSKFVSEVLGLKVKILKMSEFINKFK